MGKSRSAVANTLRLTQLPGSVQRMITMGELSAGHARALLALSEPGEQRDLAERVVAEGLSVRQVEALVKPSNRDGAGAEKSSGSRSGASGKKSAAALEIEDRLGDRFDTRVEVFETMGTGRIVVNFADGDDLARIYEVMLGGG